MTSLRLSQEDQDPKKGHTEFSMPLALKPHSNLRGFLSTTINSFTWIITHWRIFKQIILNGYLSHARDR